MNSNKKQNIIHEFQEMDVTMLDILLKDEQTYQDYSKAIFLEYLDKLFNLFKQEGDTQLFINPGKCEGCQKGCKGYEFIGNYSKFFTTFIFEEAENDYSDIYYCLNFEPTKRIENLNFKFSFDIDLNKNFEDEDHTLPF